MLQYECTTLNIFSLHHYPGTFFQWRGLPQSSIEEALRKGALKAVKSCRREKAKINNISCKDKGQHTTSKGKENMRLKVNKVKNCYPRPSSIQLKILWSLGWYSLGPWSDIETTEDLLSTVYFLILQAKNSELCYEFQISHRVQNGCKDVNAELIGKTNA